LDFGFWITLLLSLLPLLPLLPLLKKASPAFLYRMAVDNVSKKHIYFSLE